MVRFATERELLDEIVRRLVAAVDPDKIILFGSRARGEAREDSDYDLLIVRPSEDATFRRSLPAYEALDGMRISKDILWKTPEEVEDWRYVKSHVISRALDEGRVLMKRPVDQLLPPEALP